MVLRRLISLEIKRLSIPDSFGDCYVYCYGMHLNGRPCAKVGISREKLSKRIFDYLESPKEHSNKSKDYDTFRIIFCLQFHDNDIATGGEKFLQGPIKKFPLYDNQPKNVEQYKLKESWDAVKKSILGESFSFADNVYVKDAEKNIKYILDKKPIYSEMEYVSPKSTPERTPLCRFDCEKCDKISTTVLEYANTMSYSKFRKVQDIGPMRAEMLVDQQPFDSLGDIYIDRQIGPKRHGYIINYIERQIKKRNN